MMGHSTTEQRGSHLHNKVLCCLLLLLLQGGGAGMAHTEETLHPPTQPPTHTHTRVQGHPHQQLQLPAPPCPAALGSATLVRRHSAARRACLPAATQRQQLLAACRCAFEDKGDRERSWSTQAVEAVRVYMATWLSVVE